MRNLLFHGLLLLVGCLLLPQAVWAVAVINNNGAIVFADDFSSGVIPAPSPYSWQDQQNDTALASDSDPDARKGWSVLERPGRSWDVQVTSAPASADDPGPYTGTNYLRIYRADAMDATVMAQFDHPPTNAVQVDLMMNIASTVGDHDAMIYLSGGPANWGWDQAHVALSAKYLSGSLGVVQYYNGAWTTTGVSYTVGQWQKWQIDYDVQAATFVLTVDGASSTPLPAYRPGPVRVLTIRAGLEGGKFYVDAVPPQQCGEAFIDYAPGDISGPNDVPDCVVDDIDLARLTATWLDCTLPDPNDCN